jgi:hypothetical protein
MFILHALILFSSFLCICFGCVNSFSNNFSVCIFTLQKLFSWRFAFWVIESVETLMRTKCFGSNNYVFESVFLHKNHQKDHQEQNFFKSRSVVARATRCVCVEIAQNIAQAIFVSINAYQCMEKSRPQMWAIFLVLNNLREINNRSIGEKIAQSGHHDQCSVSANHFCVFYSAWLDCFPANKICQIFDKNYFSTQLISDCLRNSDKRR